MDQITGLLVYVLALVVSPLTFVFGVYAFQIRAPHPFVAAALGHSLACLGPIVLYAVLPARTAMSASLVLLCVSVGVCGVQSIRTWLATR